METKRRKERGIEKLKKGIELKEKERNKKKLKKNRC
jgi:hypothetical protein